MFFKKKKKEEPVVEVVVEKQPKIPDAIDTWGTNGKAIVTGYLIKAFRIWNFNNANKAIPEEIMEQLLIGLQMAFTSLPPEKAIALFEEYAKTNHIPEVSSTTEAEELDVGVEADEAVPTEGESVDNAQNT